MRVSLLRVTLKENCVDIDVLSNIGERAQESSRTRKALIEKPFEKQENFAILPIVLELYPLLSQHESYKVTDDKYKAAALEQRYKHQLLQK